jgi:hypothetical protein
VPIGPQDWFYSRIGALYSASITYTRELVTRRSSRSWHPLAVARLKICWRGSRCVRTSSISRVIRLFAPRMACSFILRANAFMTSTPWTNFWRARLDCTSFPDGVACRVCRSIRSNRRAESSRPCARMPLSTERIMLSFAGETRRASKRVRQRPTRQRTSPRRSPKVSSRYYGDPRMTKSFGYIRIVRLVEAQNATSFWMMVRFRAVTPTSCGPLEATYWTT